MKGWYTIADGLAEVTVDGDKASTDLLFFNQLSDTAIEKSLRLEGGELTPEICDEIVSKGEYPEGIINEAATKEWFYFHQPHKLYKK